MRHTMSKNVLHAVGAICIAFGFVGCPLPGNENVGLVTFHFYVAEKSGEIVVGEKGQRFPPSENTIDLFLECELSEGIDFITTDGCRFVQYDIIRARVRGGDTGLDLFGGSGYIEQGAVVSPIGLIHYNVPAQVGVSGCEVYFGAEITLNGDTHHLGSLTFADPGVVRSEILGPIARGLNGRTGPFNYVATGHWTSGENATVLGGYFDFYDGVP